MGKEFVVSQDGTGDYSTISEAIENAETGTKIYVKPGSYEEYLYIDKDIELQNYFLASLYQISFLPHLTEIPQSPGSLSLPVSRTGSIGFLYPASESFPLTGWLEM